MSSKARVCIAGIGVAKTKKTALIASSTKALLDAGIHFDDVDKAVVGSKDSYAALKAFDSRGIETEHVKADQELGTAYTLISNSDAKCVLVVTGDESSSISLVLMSDHMLWRHPYLKDTGICIEKSQASQSAKSGTLHDLCHIVFAQRGWAKGIDRGDKVKIASDVFTLTRVDGRPVPNWEDIEHKQDGRNRVGYNPAKETKDINLEDFEAVRAWEGRGTEPSFQRRGGDRAALAKL